MVGLFLQNMCDPFAKHEAGQDYVDFMEFGGSKAFDTMGFADSEGAANGRAGTQEVDAEKLENLELKRKEREKRDETNELFALAQEMKEQLIESVTFSNGQFHMFGMDIDEEDMDAAADEAVNDIEGLAERYNLTSSEKAELTTLLLAYQNAETPQEKAEILTKISEKQPEIGREIAQDAASKSEMRKQSELTNDEEKNASVSIIDNQEVFAVARSQTLENRELVSENVAMRADISIGDNLFANISNVSSKFNESASGIEVAEVAPQNIAEAQINAPILSNG